MHSIRDLPGIGSLLARIVIFLSLKLGLENARDAIKVSSTHMNSGLRFWNMMNLSLANPADYGINDKTNVINQESNPYLQIHSNLKVILNKLRLNAMHVSRHST
jgi:hypothetical protein